MRIFAPEPQRLPARWPRWIAPALILAGVNLSTREIAQVLITYTLAGVLLMMVYGRLVKHPVAGNRR